LPVRGFRNPKGLTWRTAERWLSQVSRHSTHTPSPRRRSTTKNRPMSDSLAPGAGAAPRPAHSAWSPEHARRACAQGFDACPCHAGV
jgi:hypothetical protein